MRSESTYLKFTGLGVAVTTPFRKGKIDFEVLGQLIDHKIDNGVDYLVALGSTGECNLLSWEEQKSILSFFVKRTKNRVPIVAGNFTDISTQVVIDRIDGFDFTGIDCLMIAAPSYVKPSQEGMYQHFMKIAKTSSLPIILYNVPGRTISNLSWKTTTRLANDSTVFIGVKEASGDLNQMINITKHRPKYFFLTSGDDDLALAVIASGGEGLISVVANAFPKETKRMISYALSGNFSEALMIQYDLFSIYALIYKEGNPTGIKGAQEILGMGSRELRLPLVALSDDSYSSLEKEMQKFTKKQ